MNTDLIQGRQLKTVLDLVVSTGASRQVCRAEIFRVVDAAEGAEAAWTAWLWVYRGGQWRSLGEPHAIQGPSLEAVFERVRDEAQAALLSQGLLS